MPGNAAAEPAAAVQAARGAGGCGCPERPSSYSGITLSEEGGQGERTRTRLIVGSAAAAAGGEEAEGERERNR